MTYNEAIRYLNSFFNYENKPYPKGRIFKLDRVKALSNLFGNPQYAYPTIHITGTKGKGSVASILSHILKEAGYKVGLFTSPHLISLCERLKINNKDIDKRNLVLLVDELKRNIKKLGSRFRPSFFEVYTTLAFNYFRKEKIDFGVFEVGLGGRFDATNIIQPFVSAITSISYDHTRELGNRLVDIAYEKAGIIKNGVDCISAPQDTDALRIIKKRCNELGARLFIVGRDITYRSLSYSQEKEVFEVKGLLDTYKNLKLPLLGEHQLLNSAVAVGIAELLILKGYKISKKAIYKGIAETKWPGRCEIIKEKPTIVLDCAHNPASAKALKKTIKRNFLYNRLILILGISYNKDIKGIISELKPLAKRIILTKASNPRSADPKYIRRFVKDKDVTITHNLHEAYQISKDLANINDIILLTGSVYLVGEFKRLV